MGRSNSLSLNTTGANLFGQQPQNNNNPPSQAGSLFGGPAASQGQGQAGGSLFGGSTGGGGGLFGNTTNTNASQPQPQQAGGLFGNSTAQQQPAGGSLFGNTTQQPQQQQQSAGLFSNMPPNQTSNNTTGGGLFGSLNQQPTQQPQQNTTSLFGTSGTSLFGNAPANNQQVTGNMFHPSQNPTSQRPPGNSLFGMSAVNPNQLNASLLGASQFRASQNPSQLPGRLSMGQAPPTAQQQAATIGAVKVHMNDLRGITRFADCVDEVQNQFETMDTMIKNQEKFCREIQALLGKHEQDVESIAPSVAVVREKARDVEMALETDAQIVDGNRKILESDRKDFGRAQRVAENLLLPPSYQVPNAVAGYGTGARSGNTDDYDTDLIGNYFLPLTTSLQTQLEQYTNNLTEIENHMRVIESSAVQQAQHLAAKRAGIAAGGNGGRGGGGSGEETVRDLAETLRGFEASILGVAGVVGECREGVDGLVLGRLGERGQVGGRGW
ncbi:hypothetical protein LTR78_009916 [Recurvomyces mirabilis]|uniref:Nucleoporin NUP49/NSP49 n=1 Tax=Recurvomyces mirabilis TaxID=574656 RepID=A0AAE0TNN6_9PEZI|nr:hypothetical protein LTR78_009916 [Recurvomyces mirabilis]KAK5160348.1 hypothetical protein LTS14_001360 [Recurvomyces mirabilis]